MSKMSKTFFERFNARSNNCLEIKSISLDMLRTMTIAKYDWGWLIETAMMDADCVLTLETLIQPVAREVATIINRERFGDEHSAMRSYPRDSALPVGCSVQLMKEDYVTS